MPDPPRWKRVCRCIDIGYIGPVPALSANVKSQGDVQILAGATKGGAVLIQRKGAGIRSVEESGRKICCYTTNWEYTAFEFAEIVEE